MASERFSFSQLWGSDDKPSTKNSLAFGSDEQAKAARDAKAKELRARFADNHTVKVRKSSLRSQLREWWDWQVPCGRSCSVYIVELIHV